MTGVFNKEEPFVRVKSETVLFYIFKCLHKYVVPKRQTVYNREEEKGQGTYWERILKLIDSKKPSLLFRLLKTLAWGSTEIENTHTEKDHIDAQIFVAVESIEGSMYPRDSEFRRLMSSAMSILFLSKQIELLKRLRLCYDIKNERKREKKRHPLYENA